MPVAKKNDVAKMTVDIIIEESPDTVTIQQEQFGMLVELAKSGAVVLPPDVLIEASGLRNKKALIEKLKGGGDLSPEQQKAQAEAQQLAQAGAQAEVAKKVADAEKVQAETQKTTVETAVMAANAMEPRQPSAPPQD
jgi:hypothetical protein